MLSYAKSLFRQPEWVALRYYRLHAMQHSRWLSGLVKDTTTPSLVARLYAALTCASGLAIPVMFYGVILHMPLLRQYAPGVLHGWLPSFSTTIEFALWVAGIMLIACLTWTRAARECNRAGLWPILLDTIDTIRLRRLVLDTPYAIVLVRYRRHFASLLDVHHLFFRLSAACACRQGVFLDHAMSTTKQEYFYAGDLAQRLVDYSNDIPAADLNLQKDLTVIAGQTPWMNVEVAKIMLAAGLRTPL